MASTEQRWQIFRIVLESSEKYILWFLMGLFVLFLGIYTLRSLANDNVELLMSWWLIVSGVALLVGVPGLFLFWFYGNVTALMWVVSENDATAIQALLEMGVDVNAKDNRGGTALMIAVFKCPNIVLEALIDKGADVDSQTNTGTTPLMFAAEEGKSSTVKLLLSKRANVNLRNNDGWTALMLAVKYQHTDIIKALVDNNADINVKNKEGQTALMLAENNIQVTQLFRKAGTTE